MQSQWEVKRTSAKAWTLWSRARLSDGTVSAWQKMGTYRTRRAAIETGMILRDRGELISWPGGAIRLGLALVESCRAEG